MTKLHESLQKIKIDNIELKAALVIPENAEKLIIFAHGSGSSRHSPRNNYIARVLRQYGLATLLIDLLTPYEDLSYQNKFDIELLTERLFVITNFIRHFLADRNLKIGYLVANTGAASALGAAAKKDNDIFAVVSRGGRPDLASGILSYVHCPVLLIVGENDDYILDLNKMIYENFNCKKDLKIIKGASHLFDEPDALEQVAELSAMWFANN